MGVPWGWLVTRRPPHFAFYLPGYLALLTVSPVWINSPYKTLLAIINDTLYWKPSGKNNQMERVQEECSTSVFLVTQIFSACFMLSSLELQEGFLPWATGSSGGLECGDISQTYQIQFIHHQYPQEIIICLYITFLWALQGSCYEFLPAAFLIPVEELRVKGYCLHISYSNNYGLKTTGNSNSLIRSLW